MSQNNNAESVSAAPNRDPADVLKELIGQLPTWIEPNPMYLWDMTPAPIAPRYTAGLSNATSLATSFGS